MIVNRTKLKIAAGKQGAGNLGQRRRNRGDETRQHLVVLELRDQTGVTGAMGILVEEMMELWRNLKGPHRNP
jgi:hypothetical protein